MRCEEVRQMVLDSGWDAPERRRVKQALEHLDRCNECGDAVDDFDQVRSALTPDAGLKAEPENGWVAFEERMLASSSRRLSRWWPTGLAVAASVIIGAFIVWAAYGKWGPTPAPSPRVSSRDVLFTPGQVAEYVKSFEQIAEVFEGQAGWVLMDDCDSDLGVAPNPMDSSHKLLLLRLTLSRGKDVVSRADLIMVPGQTAKPSVPFLTDQKLLYCIDPLPNDASQLSVRLKLMSGRDRKEPVAALATTFRAGQEGIMPAGQIVVSGVRYDLNIGVAWSSLRKRG